MNYLVYKHTSPSGKAYIGFTRNLCQRNNRHHQPGCAAFYNAIQKYGWAAFTHEILSEGLTFEEAKVAEIKLIEEHNTLFPNGYNLTTGGSVNKQVSEDTRAKISAAKKGNVVSAETRAKISEKLKGRKQSPDTIAKKIATKQHNGTGKGSRRNPEAIRKMIETNKTTCFTRKGVKWSPEAIAKRSASRRGKPVSDATRYKKSKTYKITNAQGECIIITNLAEWCRQNGVNETGLRKVVYKILPSYKGWLCEEIQEHLNN